MILAALDAVAIGLVALAAALTILHVVVYPWSLRRLAALRPPPPPPADVPEADLPAITVVAPAHNEEAVIERKIANLAALDYPVEKLEIVVALDGCTDRTVERARAAVARAGAVDRIKLVVSAENVGKRATINRRLLDATGEIVVFTDASAIVGEDALRRVARWFVADGDVGVVCGAYGLGQEASDGERAYWRYQSGVKAAEAAVAAPMGAHGAFYAVRRAFARPLEVGVVNDDFVLPMRIVRDGAAAVYDSTVVAIEIERAAEGDDYRRRVRLGAGNMQQTLLLAGLANPSRGALAYLFAAGKGLRPLLPLLIGAAILATGYLAARGVVLFQLGALGLLGLGAVWAIARAPGWTPPPLLRTVDYALTGLLASGVGAATYLWRGGVSRWSARKSDAAPAEAYMPPAVRVGKRALDIVLGLGFGLGFLLLFIPIAVAIRLDSPGPIFYAQLRVGRATRDQVRLFRLVKFRSMYVDAEARSGPVWASKNDPRVTRVGAFLRKTRLDELPQAINVLRGEMSFIGPRPERPKFIGKLDEAIPFYQERVLGLKPGVTGLAQVYAGYDEDIEDVNNKVLYDHAYAARLSSVSDWLRADAEVLVKTVAVVVGRKGQ